MKRNLFSSRVAEIALTMKEIFFFCYTYGLFNTPESLNDYCQDWELADDCEEQ